MLEYRYLEALATIVEEKGFEKAGEVLHITQSAVTQRLRQLEDISGQVLLIRSKPPKLTDAGRVLLEHFRKVRILEQELASRTEVSLSLQKPRVPLAINADSIATWFSPVIARYAAMERGCLEISSADQDVTHTLMTDGAVMGCISSRAHTFRGCSSVFLGNMKYRFVAAEAFVRRYFPAGVEERSLLKAPKLNFNRDDQLLKEWAQDRFPSVDLFQNSHFVPSSEQFPLLIRQGVLCGMLPDMQFREEEGSYHLVDLSLGRPLEIPLYWHRWSIASKELDLITSIIREEADAYLS